MNSIYSEIITAKNNTPIPLLKDGRTVDSKYNPENEAQRIVNTLDDNTSFFVQPGIGSGCIAQKLLEKYPYSKIICVENSSEDLDFLMQLEKVRMLKACKNVVFCTTDELTETIVRHYIPSFYGNLEIAVNRAWTSVNNNLDYLNRKINEAISIVKADFSVQAHFGKLWMSNIFHNLRLFEKINPSFTADISKTALILAAGPSLDNSLKLINDNPDKYFVIATDTSFSVLRKKKLKCDAVVSIDAQNVSHNHFYNCHLYKDTIFVFDLCADKSSVKMAVKNGLKTVLAHSEHPLSSLASTIYPDNFIKLYNGSGTVTISATDFAIKCGFKKIIVCGADFSYIKKPYASGTYLDELYAKDSNKINTIEKQFSKLMYRTELIALENSKTTQVLQSYRKSFEDYLIQNNCIFSRNDNIYTITLKNQNKAASLKNTFNFKEFTSKFEYKEKEIKYIEDLSEYDISLLPLNSWLKNFDNKNNKTFTENLKFSYNYIKRYFV
ncbi:MAG: motility associated factor glycosyltransferase family protein [Treponema sp.]|nr:motility associated factor glycosyltransferase family protein [Treponema sp.]